MVFPFKQLRQWASRKKTDDNNSNSNTRTEPQASNKSVFPISFPILERSTAPRPRGEAETRAYLAGDRYALTRLTHAQFMAVAEAQKTKTVAPGPNRYSIRARGDEATRALAAQPDDSTALAELLTKMEEAQRMRNRRVPSKLPPKLPRFHRDAGGFVPFRELVGQEVDIGFSPRQSARSSRVPSIIVSTVGETDDPDRLPLNVACEINSGRGKEAAKPRVVSADTSQPETVKNEEEEYVQPPSRWSSSTESSDDDGGEDTEDENFGKHREARVTDLPPRPLTPNRPAPAIPDAPFSTIYAHIQPLSIPSRLAPRPLARTKRDLAPRTCHHSPSKSVQVVILPQDYPPAPLVARPKYHYTHPTSLARLIRLRRYLSLPADLPTADLLVRVLKMGKGVRNDAAKACPRLEYAVAGIDWEGVEEEVAARGGERLVREWDVRMVSTFVQAGVSLLAWDAEDEDDGCSGEGGGVREKKHRHKAKTSATRCRTAGGEEEDMREKYKIVFKKQADWLLPGGRRTGVSGGFCRPGWKGPGRSSLYEVSATDADEAVEEEFGDFI